MGLYVHRYKVVIKVSGVGIPQHYACFACATLLSKAISAGLSGLEKRLE